ncbi:uncharacterized protein N7506_001671, partial [Penicillium brevicompactum]|uniref:uncharacterized protein n=1 Tax=Penicillium brevicompactum TaxID=5074 RepID=UPI0025405AB3
ARRVQALLSVLSWPCAFAAVFTTHGRAESWIQLVFITLSPFASAFMLCRYRKTQSKSYAPLEIALDALMTAMFLGIYLAGIIILANLHVNRYSYTIARGIPQIYSNLSCFLIFLAYLRSFAQGFYHRYFKQMIKARRGVTYVICPSCDRSAEDLNSNHSEMKGGKQDDSTSASAFGALYSDHDVESQPLLVDNTTIAEGEQITGVVNKD